MAVHRRTWCNEGSKQSVIVAAAFALGSIACGGSPATHSSGGGNGAGTSSTGGSSNTGGTGVGGTLSTAGTSTVVDVETSLPPLPAMVNVSGAVVHDSVDISFLPVDDARDYRVYVLPKNEDIAADSSGRLTIQNATYRCAGDRQASRAVTDAEPDVQGLAIRTLVDGQDVNGYVRSLAEATLGHVYVNPGAGRIPVYALGDPATNADVQCDFSGVLTRWAESRSKTYTASEGERSTLLSQGWRDDGVVFYVPATAAANTRSVYTQNPETDQNTHVHTRFYYVDGAEAAMRGTGDVSFQVLTEALADTQPLGRVFYRGYCSISHDELTVGKSEFERARYQGDQKPVFNLHWSGITEETTLVVEALAEGCPYQGFLTSESKPARDIDLGQYGILHYPEWVTVDDVRASSPSGEVYVNGQHDVSGNPRPIARSFLKVSPAPKPDMDWFWGFSDPAELGTLENVYCGQVGGDIGTCWQEFKKISPTVDATFMLTEQDRWAMAPVLGELWVSFGDIAADVNGKFRLTPTLKSELHADTFLHATMTVDTFTTGRRYPQIIISDQDIPVQENMEQGYALVFQTFGGWPNMYQLEVCDHQFWDVNQQCPTYDFYHVADPQDPATIIALAPNAEVAEASGLDRGTRFDVYASLKRAYLFLNGQPYGCADLPAATVPAGPVTVTFGDVLYHSGVDQTFAFTAKAMQVSTRRHYDNLGFDANVPAPAWDESRLPCASPATMKQP